MKRLTVYCEGQTEEMVVQRVLRPHLQLHGVQDVRPVLAANSLEPEGRRGGFVNWDAIEFDLRQITATPHTLRRELRPRYLDTAT